MRRLIVLGVALSGCAVFVDPGSVDRRLRGETHEGRFVDETAYEVSLTAAIQEAAGDRDKAEGGYLLLTRLDPSSADAWSRLGLVRCQRGVSAAYTDDAFARAVSAEPDFAAAYLRRGRCAFLRGQRAQASADAQRAFELQPTSIETTLFLAEMARVDGNEREADRLMRGARAVSPVEMARASGKRAKPVTRRDVDRALLGGRYDEARADAVEAGVSKGELALRASALGRLAFARDLARALAANQDDVDARVALFASDPAAPPGAPSLQGASQLALAVLRDVLTRRGMGEQAAAIVVGPSDDQLIVALAGRK